MKTNAKMELILIQFQHSGRLCIMPSIVNFADLKKRQIEDKIISEILDLLKHAEGVSKVLYLPAGLGNFEELESEFHKIANLQEHNISFLHIKDKFFTEKVEDEYYGTVYYRKVLIKERFAFPVRIIDRTTSPDFIGNIPLPILYKDIFIES